MFVDEVTVEFQAGAGGNGVSTFRREKYVPRGGPDGGDGGQGGSVVLIADPELNTLLDFRYRHVYKAQPGSHGQRSTKHGRDAADLELKVPVGTTLRDADTGELIGDLVEPGQRLVVAAGGRGGRGNARFATATNQAPRFAENGEPGTSRRVQLELRLLADVGLVGLPNAGKSSLLAQVSAARPKVADYPFTTLTPVLGVVDLGEHRSCVFADIPGLIEGAHSGLGLGHQFLRHIERTRMLVHVLDVTGGDSEDALQNYDVVMHELGSHNPRLGSLPQLVALNKVDIATPEMIDSVSQALAARGVPCQPISAATGEGKRELLYRVAEMLPPRQAINDAPAGEEDTAGEDGRTLIEAPERRRPSRRWEVNREADGVWRVSGEGLERLVAMTNVDNESAMDRLHRVLDEAGVLAALKAACIQDGDPVRIRNTEFVFVEEERVYEPRRRRRARGGD